MSLSHKKIWQQSFTFKMPDTLQCLFAKCATDQQLIVTDMGIEVYVFWKIVCCSCSELWNGCQLLPALNYVLCLSIIKIISNIKSLMMSISFNTAKQTNLHSKQIYSVLYWLRALCVSKDIDSCQCCQLKKFMIAPIKTNNTLSRKLFSNVPENVCNNAI